MTWADWAGYFWELVKVSSFAVMAIYLWKLLGPQRFHDRLAAVGLGLAFLGAGGALWGGMILGATPAWALFVWPLLGMFWLLESEFGTRILGLVAGLAALAGQVVFPWQAAVPGGKAIWATLTASGAILAGSFLLFALGTWALAVLYRYSSTLSARKTARFFVMNQPIIAELAYRLNGWALPFAIFAGATASFGLAAGQVPGSACLAIILAGACSGAYALRARGATQDAGIQPVWLVLGGGLLVWGYRSLGLMSALSAA
jgi:hypothetical protein